MGGAKPTAEGYTPTKCMFCRKGLPPNGPVEQLPGNLKFCFHAACLNCISCQKPLTAKTAVLQGALVVCSTCGGEGVGMGREERDKKGDKKPRKKRRALESVGFLCGYG